MVDMKPTISLIWIGHVDHGKSTTLGHLLYQIGAIDPRIMEKLKEEAVQHQMESWKWAYILDTLPEEKQRGITSDIAFYTFETEKRNFMLIDAPGHRDFVKNMIRGAAQADACVLVVSAVPNDLKSGLKIGGYQDPGGQTREHAILASVLGIQQLIVAINKLDSVDFREDRFYQAVDLIKKLLKEIQSPWAKKLDLIPFIPISGLLGDNLALPSENLKWYSGPTLIEALNSLEGVVHEEKKGMRFVTYDLDERHGFGTLLVGKVISSALKTRDEIKILPLGIKTDVKEIWIQDAKVSTLKAGEHGSILLRNIDKDNIEEGVVLAPGNIDYSYASVVRSRLLILEGSLVPGSSVVFHCGATYVTAQIFQITKILRMNPKHKKLPREFEGKITIAFEGELIEVDIALDATLVVEKFSDFPELGRVILRHSGTTIAVGVVNDLFKDSDYSEK
ncbi:MAG: GTP-binding protein [Candidatus Hodarchaeota archaeon]